MASIPFSFSGVRYFFWRIGYLFVLLYRKNIIKAAAVYTTFSSTINKALLAVSGKTGWMSVGISFVNEAYSKFLGAAPNLLEAFKALNSLHLVDAAWFFWQGAAALIMMFFIYSMLFGKGMTREIEWPEKALVLALWLSISSQVHGTGLIVSLFDQVRMFFESLQSVLPDFSGNTTANVSANLPLNGSNAS